MVNNLDTQKTLFKLVKEKSVLTNETISLPYMFASEDVDEHTNSVLEKRLFALS